MSVFGFSVSSFWGSLRLPPSLAAAAGRISSDSGTHGRHQAGTRSGLAGDFFRRASTAAREVVRRYPRSTPASGIQAIRQRGSKAEGQPGSQGPRPSGTQAFVYFFHLRPHLGFGGLVGSNDFMEERFPIGLFMPRVCNLHGWIYRVPFRIHILYSIFYILHSLPICSFYTTRAVRGAKIPPDGLQTHSGMALLRFSLHLFSLINSSSPRRRIALSGRSVIDRHVSSPTELHSPRLLRGPPDNLRLVILAMASCHDDVLDGAL